MTTDMALPMGCLTAGRTTPGAGAPPLLQAAGRKVSARMAGMSVITKGVMSMSAVVIAVFMPAVETCHAAAVSDQETAAGTEKRVKSDRAEENRGSGGSSCQEHLTMGWQR